MVLLERDLHLEALRSALREAGNEGCVVLVYGEAGIGKTALVGQFIKEQHRSRRILQGACDSLFTPRPLGPLHDVALQISSPKGTPGSLLALLDSESNRNAIFSACLNELKNESTILIIEDVHWADEATFDLLKYLARRIQQTRSLMLLTYRDDELGVDQPLRLLLGDLATSKALHRIPVLSLSKDAVRELAKHRNVDSAALHRLTNGNPFFVTEVLAVESGIPETVRDAVLARAARLSPSARAVLEAAAVIGVRVEPWLLSNIVGTESVYVEECIAGGVLQSQGGYYAFRHELARQTILESISPQRKIKLHRMVLKALKESPETCNDLARLANHAEETKDVDAVLEYAPAAARQASAARSHREAAALYELALHFADSMHPAAHAQMLEAYVVELDYRNRIADQIPVLQKAIKIWHSIGDRLREGVNLEDLAEAFHLLGRNTESEEASKVAIAMLEELPPSAELARAYKGQCYIRMRHRDCTEAVVWGEKAVALAESFSDTETLVRTYDYLGSAILVNEYERGRALLEKSLTLGRQANLTFAVAGALGDLGEMSVEVYQLERADSYLARGIAYSLEQDDDYHLQYMLPSQALTRLYQGRWVEAAEITEKALARADLDIEARAYALLAHGRLRARQGAAGVQGILDEALKISMQADSVPRMARTQTSRIEAAWLADGDAGLVLNETHLIYDLTMSKKHPWIVGELAFWCWRMGEEISPPEWIAKPFAAQIAGDWRGAAVEWQGRGCPYEQAMALMDGDEAAQLMALEIFERLGARPILEKLKQKMRTLGIRIPRGPRLATRENPFGLTPREMELLSCLAGGMSNNAIAKKLSLSPRTVEHHIASILQKMGVGSRNEAVTLALKDKLLPSE